MLDLDSLQSRAARLAACGATRHDASLGLFAEGVVAEACSLDENPGARRRVGLQHRLLAPLVLFAMLLAPPEADATTYRDLCTSVPEACEYTGPDAPALAAEVCHGSAGTWLRGESCPAGTWPYFVRYGEVVDPTTNWVVPYIPLDDACDSPGLCVDGPPPSDAQPYLMCCTGNTSGGDSTCVDGSQCGGTIWYCFDGVSNDDGTITCFDQLELT